MAKTHRKKPADDPAPFPKSGCALVQVLHERLAADAEGKLSEMPELLAPVEMLREAIKKYSGAGFNVSTQPYIKVGEYGVRIWLQETKQHDSEISNRYHALTVSVHHWYEAIVKNAESERPLSLKALNIPKKILAILKALAKLGKLSVDTILTTEDGQVSKFPHVGYKYLSATEGEVQETKVIQHLLIGVDLGANKQLLVHLEKSHWLALHFSDFANACLMASQGHLLVGTAEIIDGAWGMREGKFLKIPKNRELPFNPIC